MTKLQISVRYFTGEKQCIFRDLDRVLYRIRGVRSFFYLNASDGNFRLGFLGFPVLKKRLLLEDRAKAGMRIPVVQSAQFQPQDRVSQRLYQDSARLIERSFKREGRELDRSANPLPRG